MSDTTNSYSVWCYIEGDRSAFPVVASPTASVGELKMNIKKEKNTSLQGVDASDLTLWKVDVDIDAVGDQIRRGEYQPDATDQPQLLQTMKTIVSPISEVWPEPPPKLHLHVFIRLPDVAVAQATIWHEAAKALHRAMWKNSLEERLQKVTESDDLIYLPRTEVNSLKLRELGCDVDTILIREEYPLVLKRLEDRRTNAVGGVVVTGQPGTGKSIFLFYLLLHLLSNGEPVALQCGEFFYLFSQDGVGMYDGNSTGWNFHFEEKIWGLSDADEVGVHPWPCPSFLRFSKQKRAYIVQTTSLADGGWKRWSKECHAGLFIMQCFTEKEAKALSKILHLDVKRFLKDFKRWGPCVRTCVGLACGALTEERLQWQEDAASAAKTFA